MTPDGTPLPAAPTFGRIAVVMAMHDEAMPVIAALGAEPVAHHGQHLHDWYVARLSTTRDGAEVLIAVNAVDPTLGVAGVGPEPALLRTMAPGVIWVAALLAAILPLDRLIEPDLEAGFFDQWALRGLAEEALILVRIVAHWISFGVPLMLAAPISAGLLSLDGAQLRTIEIGLAVGTPGLAAIGVTIAALTAGLRAGSALGGLLAIPLTVPLLIFGAGSLQPGGEGGLFLLAASSVAALAIAPFAAGGAIRAGRE